MTIRVLTSSIDSESGENELVEYELDSLDGDSLARAHQKWIESFDYTDELPPIRCVSFTMKGGRGAYVLDEGELLSAGVIYTSYVSENRDDITRAY